MYIMEQVRRREDGGFRDARGNAILIWKFVIEKEFGDVVVPEPSITSNVQNNKSCVKSKRWPSSTNILSN